MTSETQPSFTSKAPANGEWLKDTTEFHPGDQFDLHLSNLRPTNEARARATAEDTIKRSSPEIQAPLPHKEAGIITLYVIHQRRRVQDPVQVHQGELGFAEN